MLFRSKWFYIGGAVGSGKTHICTAICNELLKKRAVTYMPWREEAVKLKTIVNDISYQVEMDKLKKVDVLYIDDFLKTKSGDQPTGGDINIAFEIINYRYNNSLTTIISSERTINEVIKVDEATGSRIFQFAKEYGIDLGKDKAKNMRLMSR